MKHLTFFILAFYSITTSFSQQKEFLYNIDIKRKFTNNALKKFSNRSDKENAKIEISAYQNPKDEFYSLKIFNNTLKLDYIDALKFDDNETHIQVKNYPLGKHSYRLMNDSLIYYRFEIGEESYHAKDTLISGNWFKTSKDSVILGYKVHQIKLDNLIGTYKAWFTKELPQSLGIGTLSYPKGFVLAYEFSYKPTPVLKSHVVKVYPYKEKKLRKKKKFKFTKPQKVYTMEKIKELFRKRNEVLNKPVEINN